MAQIKNSSVTYKDSTYNVLQKDVSEIFYTRNSPYLIVATTNSGKTTLAIDLIYKKAESSTVIYYFTATKESLRDTTISCIPKYCRRSPTFESISNAWKEVTAMQESIDGELVVNMKKILTKIYGNEESTQLYRALETEKQKIITRESAKYESLGMNPADAEADGTAFEVETLSRIVISETEKIESCRNITTDDILLVHGLMSDTPNYLFIMDDMSEQFQESKTSKTKVDYDGKLMSEADAFRSLMLAILTRGRHYNGIIAIFIHDINLVNKNQINNMIFMDSKSCEAYSRQQSAGEIRRLILQEYSKISKNTLYAHFFIFYSANHPDEIVFGKADLHASETLVLNSLTANMIKVYNTILQGNMVDDDDESESISGADVAVADTANLDIYK